MRYNNILYALQRKMYGTSILLALFAGILSTGNGLIAAPVRVQDAAQAAETINFTITVKDKGSSLPLQSVLVVLKKGTVVVAKAVTNPFGRACFNDLEAGSYRLSTSYIGYGSYSGTVSLDSLHRNIEVRLSEKNIELGEVLVQGEKENNVATSIDIRTGRQTFEGETYHAAPQSSMTKLISENLAGAAKATTGEVHIRGQHGEFSYLVDGIPIPLGVFGGLNEIVDPAVLSRVTFYTGGFPAEYGGQITGIMDIQNRVPTGSLHLDASSFIGSYLTSEDGTSISRAGKFRRINSNGQNLSMSDHAGALGYFFSASRQETDRRIDQPVSDLFHDHGFDYFTYGKLDYLIGQNDYLTANLNYSLTHTQVPYDPAEGYAADMQRSYNAFQTLSYYHTYSSRTDREANLFLGAFVREGGLKFTPNINDQSLVFISPDTTTGYLVAQKRTFVTSGIRAKYDQSLSHQFEYALGINYSNTSGTENFNFFNSYSPAIRNISDYNGYDLGAFVQTKWHPLEWMRLDIGMRYDLHNAPSISNSCQLSPRIKWNCFIDESNTLSFSYDRLFMPTNIENLGAVASQISNNASLTYPEKDNLYEISFVRNWAMGFNSKISGFYKDSEPGLDDETLGSSTIRVNVNVAKIKVTGLELSMTYNDLNNPLSGYVNASLIHAYGRGPVSGGFIVPDSSTAVFDLDHDQRLSMVIGLNYQPVDWFLNFNATYGSGLTNGNSDCDFRTGLFSFNPSGHTACAWIFNLSGGYKFYFSARHSLEPSVYITNIFDHKHLIKGAFFSGASIEERRNLVFELAYHF